MKNSFIIISGISFSLALVAFGFSNTNPECEVPTNQQLASQHISIIKFPTIVLPQVEKEAYYAVGFRNNQPIKMRKLIEAKSLGDLIPKYPSNWITDYISVEVVSILNDQKQKATGLGYLLNEEQKKLLNQASPTMDIEINVKYKVQNSATDNKEERLMHVLLSLIPEKEAEFIGGYDNMIAFLRENSNDRITTNHVDPRAPASIYFTVSEIGEIENVKLNNSSNNQETDVELMKLISSMPRWSSAKNLTGVGVKQNFMFLYGIDGC